MNLALKDRAEVELESIMGLSRGSALTFFEVNIGLSAVTLNTDLLRCPERIHFVRSSVWPSHTISSSGGPMRSGPPGSS